MDTGLMNDLTTTYMLIGVVVAIMLAAVFNLETLTGTAKIFVVMVVLASAIGFGYYLHLEQDTKVVKISMNTADNASVAFGNVVRQLHR